MPSKPFRSQSNSCRDANPRRWRNLLARDWSSPLRRQERPLTLETLEDRLTPATVDVVTGLGSITFEAASFAQVGNEFTASAADGPVRIGFTSFGALDPFRPLLDINLNAGGSVKITRTATSTFDVTNGSLVVTATTGLQVPIWQTTGTSQFQTADLLGTQGLSLSGTGNAIAFSRFGAEVVATSVLLRNDSGNSTQDSYVGLQGNLGFSFAPEIRVEVTKNNYVYAKKGGLSLTGLDVDLSTPSLHVKGLTFGTLNLNITYQEVATKDEFKLRGGFTAFSSDDGNLSTDGTLSAGSLGGALTLEITNGLFTQIGGSFNADFKAFGANVTGDGLSFSYKFTEDEWKFSGNLIVAVPSKVDPNQQNGFNVVLGTTNGSTVDTTSGLIVKDGVVQNLNAFIDANSTFGLFAVKFQVLDRLVFVYDRASSQFEMTGGVLLDIGTNNKLALSADLVSQNGEAGLVIKDGKMTTLDMVVSAGFELGGLRVGNATPNSLGVSWSDVTGNDVYTLTGSATFQNIFDVQVEIGQPGVGNLPGITILNGEVRFDDLKVLVKRVPLGAFEIREMLVQYDKLSTGIWTLDVGLEVLFPGGWEVGGELTFLNGDLNSIEINYASEGNEGIALGDSGLFLTYAEIAVTNLHNATLPVTVAGDVVVTFGPQTSSIADPREPGNGTKTGSLVAAQGSFLANEDELAVQGGVYFGAVVTSREPITRKPTYEGLLGQGVGYLNLDWAARIYSVNFDTELLDGAFELSAGATFKGTPGDYTLFVDATADLAVPKFVPVIGGLQLASANFILDYEDNQGVITGFAAGWLDVLGFTAGAKYDIGTGQWSLVGKQEAKELIDCEANPELCLSGTGPFNYHNSFTVPSGATAALLGVDWKDLAGNQSLAVVLPGGSVIQQQDFPQNNITIVRDLSGPGHYTVSVLANSNNPFQTLPPGTIELQLISTVQFDAHPDFTSGFTYPPPTASVTSALNLPNDGNRVRVRLDGQVDPGFRGNLTARLFVDTDNTGYDGTALPASNVTLTPVGGSNYTLTGDIDLGGLFFRGYYVYASINDGVNKPVDSSYSPLPVYNTAPIIGMITNSAPGYKGQLISGITVYVDVDDNGKYEPGSDPSAVSNTDGSYTITDPKGLLTDGQRYNLRLVLPPGTLVGPTSPNRPPVNFTYNSGQTIGFDFELDLFAGVNGFVFTDLNKDGVYVPGDPPVPGIRVYADLNDNGRFDPLEPNTITLTQGEYHMYGLKLDTDYTLRIELPDTYYPTQPTTIANIRLTDQYQQVENANFGVLPKKRISGTVTGHPLDQSGVLSPTAVDLGNWTVNLYRSGNTTLLASTTTDVNGHYQFVVEDGNYTVSQVVQSGWLQLEPSSEGVPPPNFTGPISNGLPWAPNSIAAADLDGDGMLDLVVNNPNGNVHVLWGDGSGRFSLNNSVAIGPTSLNVAVADTTGSGFPDVLTWGGNNGGVYRIQNLGHRQFGSSTKLADVENDFYNGGSYTITPYDLAVGDLDGDGRDDIAQLWQSVTTGNIFNSTAYGLMIWLSSNPGHPQFINVDHATTPVVEQSNAGFQGQGLIQIVDLRNSGQNDIVFAGSKGGNNSGITVALNNGNASSFTFGSQSFPSATNLGFNDINGDGLPDLVYLDRTNQNFVFYQRGMGDGTFDNFNTKIPSGNFTIATAPNINFNMYVLDVNGDLLPDVVPFVQTSNPNGYYNNVFPITLNLTYYVNQKSAPYYSGTGDTYGYNSNSGYLNSSAVGDVNGDGFADLILMDANNSVINVFVNASTFNTTSASVVVPAGGPSQTADFVNGALGRINGNVYEDKNRNGTREVGDVPLAGVQLYVDLNHNNVHDAGELLATTGHTGAYAFAGLADGNYTIRVLTPDRFLAGDAGDSFTLVLGAGQTATDRDIPLLRRWLKPVADVTANPGQSVGFTLEATGAATDSHLRYLIAPGSPPGASIDPLTGQFTWTAPVESGYYTFEFDYHDPFEPVMRETAEFTVLVPAPRAGSVGTLPPVDFLPTPIPSTAPSLPTTPNFAAFPVPPDKPTVYTAVSGGNGWVRVFDYGSGVERFRFQPFGDFTGGVRVAVADVTGDTIPDIITGAGPGGGPHVKVFDGATGAQVDSFFAFDSSFTGGVFVAAGDMNGDGHAEIVVTPDAGGGPVVAVFDGQTRGQLASVYVFEETFTGGLRVAAGDVNRDGAMDVVVTVGPGGGPRVAGLDGAQLASGKSVRLFNDFYGLDSSLEFGFRVTVGDADGDGYGEIFLSTDAGGGPRVVAFDGQQMLTAGPKLVSSIFASDTVNPFGLRVKALDLDADGRVELLSAEGDGASPVAYVHHPLTGVKLDAFYAWALNDLGGIEVG